MTLTGETDITRPDYLLIDGKRGKLWDSYTILYKHIIKGDLASHSIAAASILAKVERDAFMREMHDSYPVYGFDQNKGYGTAAHMAAIAEHGISPLHRKSFLTKYQLKSGVG